MSVAPGREPPDRDQRQLYRVGGVAGIGIAVGYVVVIGLFIWVGAPPDGGLEWLAYGAVSAAQWWGILAISVLTDLLYLPLALGLYLALRAVNRDMMLLAAVLITLFVILDLAITWPNYATMIMTAERYAAATNDVQRAALLAVAEIAATNLSSDLLAAYIILVPGLGVLAASLVMLRTTFSRLAAYIGVLTGISATVAGSGDSS